MSNARFDILFSGESLPGADPAEVRRRVQALFRVSDEAAQRLFSGVPVTVKRGVDAESTRRYDALFREAGALVRILPAAGEGMASAAAANEPNSVPPPPPSASTAPQLGLAAPGDDPLEPPVRVATPALDLRHLALVDGDWDLADCSPPPPPLALPDIEHLRLVPEDELRRPAPGD